jgi:hypothetical protein
VHGGERDVLVRADVAGDDGAVGMAGERALRSIAGAVPAFPRASERGR